MFPRVIALLLSFLCIDVVMAVDTADAPLQLSQASNEEIDAELLAIFLEEANEVLATIYIIKLGFLLLKSTV